MLKSMIPGLLFLSTLASAETRLLVKLKDPSPESLTPALQSLLYASHEIPGLPHWRAYRVEDSRKRDTIKALSETPGIEWVEEDQLYFTDPELRTEKAPDPREGEQWALNQMGVKAAWARVPAEAPEILVAVTDTGVDGTHPDLSSRMYVNAGEIPNNGKDDDQNGFVDDVSGWNFEAKTNDASDDYHHGTHVAGIIGAVRGNGIGVAGVAPKVRLLSVRWTKQGAGWGEDAIAAIHYSVKMGARIINASWGGIGYSKALEDAVREAESHGILFVASAGNGKADNDVKPHHPANLRFSNVISVASTDEKDQLEPYSNFGANQVELAAPGKAILSTMIRGQYGLLSGTSMAAAEVSGVAALVLSINPKLRAQEVKRILMASVKQVPALQGKTITGGRVDADQASLLAHESLQSLNESAAVLNESDLSGGSVSDRARDLRDSPGTDSESSGRSFRPDSVEAGAVAPGLSVRVVRLVKGVETPVPSLEMKVQLHGDGNFQHLVSDSSGVITDPVCKKESFTASAFLETPRFSVGDGSPFSLLLPFECGKSLKLVFRADSDGGQALGIWQTATRAKEKLQAEVGLQFWRRPIEFIWPGKGDYYSGGSVNLTRGDHWDVVSHELGHAIYDQAGIGTFGGGQHYMDQCYSEAMALSEGWASFFAGWLNLEPSDPDAKFEYMVPRRAPIRFETVPADVCGKSTNEWRVISWFWDLIDTHQDGEQESESFLKLWTDLSQTHASSTARTREILLGKGWDRDRLNSLWKMDFPAESTP